MSNILSGNPDKDVHEQMALLEEMGDKIMTAESQRMEAKAWEDRTLPIVSIVDTQTFCRIGVEVGESLSKGIGDVIGDFVKGKWMDGIKDGIHTVLSQLLGSATSGRQESRQFHIAFGSNALLRIDTYFYMYTFKSEGSLRKHGNNMLCTVAQVSVLNSLKTDPQLILYEVTKAIGVEKMEEALESLEKETGFAKSLYQHIRSLNKSYNQPALEH